MVRNFCDERGVTPSQIKESLLEGVKYALEKSLDDHVITTEERDYFLGFLGLYDNLRVIPDELKASFDGERCQIA